MPTAHSPADFDPLAYAFVGAFDRTPEPGTYAAPRGLTPYTVAPGVVVYGATLEHAEDIWLRSLLAASPSSEFGLCDHCGAHPRYMVVLRHRPSGDYIAVGETCADNRVQSMDRASWKVKALREAAAHMRKTAAGRMARRANLTAAPDLVEWLEHHAEGWIPRPLWNLRRANVEATVWDATELSEAREAAAAFDAEEARRFAERQARPSAPAPAGRVEVTGRIVFVKLQEGDYGTTWKMLLEADPGFKVWGSIPKAVLTAAAEEEGWNYDAMDLKGRRVTFTATLEPKDEDPSFAWASRPSKATLEAVAP